MATQIFSLLLLASPIASPHRISQLLCPLPFVLLESAKTTTNYFYQLYSLAQSTPFWLVTAQFNFFVHSKESFNIVESQHQTSGAPLSIPDCIFHLTHNNTGYLPTSRTLPITFLQETRYLPKGMSR